MGNGAYELIKTCADQGSTRAHMVGGGGGADQERMCLCLLSEYVGDHDACPRQVISP